MDTNGSDNLAHIIQFTLAANDADRRRAGRPPRPRRPGSPKGDVLMLPWSLMGAQIRPDLGGWLSGPCL